MSNRAAYNFLSSISLGGQTQKKETQPSQSQSQSQLQLQQQQQLQLQQQQQQQQQQHSHHHHKKWDSHREHFKDKLANTLERKHALIPKHEDKQITVPNPTANKPSSHPSSIKRSTSNISIPSESNTSQSNLVVRSTSGTSIPNREPNISPRDSKASPRDPPNEVSVSKARNSSLDQGNRHVDTKTRNSADYSRKSSIDHNSKHGDASASGKIRAGSVDQGFKHIEQVSQSKLRNSLDYGGGRHGEERRKSASEHGTKSSNAADAKARAQDNMLPNSSSKAYRKLSKSTNDASSRSISTSGGSTSTSTGSTSSKPSNHKSSSSSNVPATMSTQLTKQGLPRVERFERRPSTEERSQQRNAVTKAVSAAGLPKAVALEPRNKNGAIKSVSMKSTSKITNENQLESTQDGENKKRHRRRKSKQSEKHKPAIKHNPAALDFLKGISLGENTPTIKHRKSLGKSKLADVYPQKGTGVNDAPRITDNILFAGSASTRKIKINDFSAQSIPGKIYFSTRSSSTFAVFSVIKYDAKANKKEKEKKQELNTLKESMAASTIAKLKSVSYAHIITAPSETQETENEQGEMVKYDPYFLDDPSLTTGKHRTVMNLACFKESIIPYVRPGVIKEELNELFRQKHPWIPSGVTLHKIRKLKKALIPIAVVGNLEVSTVALAYVFFEKLIMKGIVTKPLIRLYGAVCLVLAAKANDPNGDKLKSVVEAIEKQLEVDSEDIVQYEFPVFAALGFSLQLHPEIVIPHILLIIKDNQDLVGNPY